MDYLDDYASSIRGYSRYILIQVFLKVLIKLEYGTLRSFCMFLSLNISPNMLRSEKGRNEHNRKQEKKGSLDVRYSV